MSSKEFQRLRTEGIDEGTFPFLKKFRITGSLDSLRLCYPFDTIIRGSYFDQMTISSLV